MLRTFAAFMLVSGCASAPRSPRATAELDSDAPFSHRSEQDRMVFGLAETTRPNDADAQKSSAPPEEAKDSLRFDVDAAPAVIDLKGANCEERPTIIDYTQQDGAILYCDRTEARLV